MPSPPWLRLVYFNGIYSCLVEYRNAALFWIIHNCQSFFRYWPLFSFLEQMWETETDMYSERIRCLRVKQNLMGDVCLKVKCPVFPLFIILRSHYIPRICGSSGAVCSATNLDCTIMSSQATSAIGKQMPTSGLLNSSSTSKLVWGCVRAGRWEQEELNRIELLEDLEKMSDSIMPSFISDPPSVKVTRMRGKPCQCHGFPFILDFLSFWFLVQLRSSGECFINFINTSLVVFSNGSILFPPTPTLVQAHWKDAHCIQQGEEIGSEGSEATCCTMDLLGPAPVISMLQVQGEKVMGACWGYIQYLPLLLDSPSPTASIVSSLHQVCILPTSVLPALLAYLFWQIASSPETCMGRLLL